jgi:hypothetical protein
VSFNSKPFVQVTFILPLFGLLKPWPCNYSLNLLPLEWDILAMTIIIQCKLALNISTWMVQKRSRPSCPNLKKKITLTKITLIWVFVQTLHSHRLKFEKNTCCIYMWPWQSDQTNMLTVLFKALFYFLK